MTWVTIGVVYILTVLYIHFRGKVRLPLRRQLLDHSTFLAPVNAFMFLFSKAPRTPCIALADLPELAPLQRNWRAIRAEAERLQAYRMAGTAVDIDDANLGAFLEKGWNYFFLKWYDATPPSARQLCPQTFALLQSIPSIKVATFAELPAGAVLGRHRDPFAGLLRYHLGIATPGASLCFIEVDGQRHIWRDGQALVFDETYVHWAMNGCASERIVLLCDIERPMRYRWAQAVSHVLGRTLMTVTNAPKDAGEQAGLAGALSRVLYHMGHYRRRFRSWSRAAYHLAAFAAVAGIAALIFGL
jgi:beta-hydroxylase